MTTLPPISDDNPSAHASEDYPLLTALLRDLGMPLRAMYSTRDFALIFGVSPRAVQAAMHDGALPFRNLFGKWHWLAIDLEEYLRESRRDGKDRKARKPR